MTVRSDDVKKSLRLENESLPGWTTEKTDVKSIYLSRIKNISKTGYGIWAKCPFEFLHDEAFAAKQTGHDLALKIYSD